MLSQVLRAEIERYYKRVRLTNPLFENARQGRLSPEAVTRYMKNLLFLIRHTPVHLGLASQLAEKRGLKEFAQFYGQRLGEEHGHELWAEADLKHLTAKFGAEAGNDLSPGMVRLVNYLGALIQKEPTHYVAYAFLAEYFTVLAVPEWLRDLEEHCGIPSSMMTVLGNHAEVDKDHVIEDMKEIDRIAGQCVSPGVLLDVLHTAMRFLEEFFGEVGAVAQEGKVSRAS